MVKHLLVTTPLEETWKENMPVVFLGEWCKLHARKEKWEGLESVICPYHWDDRGKLMNDYHFISEIYERLLADLSVHLNKIHRKDMSIRAWRILLGPWLGYFIQMLFDRWCMIQYVAQSADNLQTIVLDLKRKEMIPADMNAFHVLYTTDVWNHFIYSLVIKEFPDIEVVNKSYNIQYYNSVALRRSLRSKLKNRIKSLYNSVAGVVNKSNGFLFINTYLSGKDNTELSKRFKQIPILLDTEVWFNMEADDDKRNWILEGVSNSAFESFVRKIISSQIPVVYLEGFSSLVSKAQRMHWPKAPKAIFSSISFNADEIFKMYTAVHVQNKVPFIIGQHGGHYGIGKWFANEDHEIAICDKYLTWGWTKKDDSKINAVGQLKGKKPLHLKHSEQPRLLLVTATVPRYSYFMYSIMVSSQWIDYFNDQCIFVSNLAIDIRNNLTVRLYKNDFGWSQLKRWQDNFPDITYDLGNIDIQNNIAETKIFVSTYNATTYLESFTMNIPTVIYWNPLHSEIRDTAKPYFDELKRVGVFHESPESAAVHINQVWYDVDKWWSSSDVKEAVNKFKLHFCYLSENLVDNIESQIRASLEMS